MLRVLCYMLNGILVAAGLWAFVKLDWCVAMVGIFIGLFNIMVLMQEIKQGPAAVTSAVLSLIAVVWGVITATQSIGALGDVVRSGDAGMWAMLDAGYALSYGLAYIAAGILTIITFIRGAESTLDHALNNAQDEGLDDTLKSNQIERVRVASQVRTVDAEDPNSPIEPAGDAEPATPAEPADSGES